LLNKEFHAKLKSEEFYFSMLGRLHIAKGVHFPGRLPRKLSWKSLYFDRKELTDMWQKGQQESSKRKFKIQVSARLKPRNHHAVSMMSQRKIILPLHQRLALIRLGHNIRNNADAIEIMKTNGEWFPALNTNNDKENNPRSLEVKGGVQVIDSENDQVFFLHATKGLMPFHFDHVLQDDCSQQEMYDASTVMLVSDFINGFNATCLVYGQTGSGKTHTMFGPPSAKLTFTNNTSEWGIIPRACADVFEAIEFRKKHLEVEIDHELTISYIEVDGDNISNLLRGREPCGPSRAASHAYVLDQSTQEKVETLDQLLGFLGEGEKHKMYASTAMNQRSTRAHYLVFLTLRQHCKETNVEFTSRLCLADLGGSERLKKSQATGKQMVKATAINMGLLALKQCVDALNRGRNESHVPYYSSKLTRLLAVSLGGNSKTSAIICAAQEQDHEAESIAAMKFGEACSQITKSTKVNTATLSEVVKKLDAAIAGCEEKIRQNERWEVREVRQVDTRAQSTDNVEIRTESVLTGAEEYREELESLLERREGLFCMQR